MYGARNALFIMSLLAGVLIACNGSAGSRGQGEIPPVRQSVTHELWAGEDAVATGTVRSTTGGRLVVTAVQSEPAWSDKIFLLDCRRIPTAFPDWFGGAGQGPGAIHGRILGVAVSDETIYVRDQAGVQVFTASGRFVTTLQPVNGLPHWFTYVRGRLYEVGSNLLARRELPGEHLIRISEMTADNHLRPVKGLLDARTFAQWAERAGFPPLNMEVGQPAVVYFASWIDSGSGPILLLCSNASDRGLLVHAEKGTVQLCRIPTDGDQAQHRVAGCFSGLGSFLVAVRTIGPAAAPLQYAYRLVRIRPDGRVQEVLDPDFKGSIPANPVGVAVQPFGVDPGCERQPGEIVISELVVTMEEGRPAMRPRLMCYRFPVNGEGGHRANREIEPAGTGWGNDRSVPGTDPGGKGS